MLSGTFFKVERGASLTRKKFGVVIEGREKTVTALGSQFGRKRSESLSAVAVEILIIVAEVCYGPACSNEARNR